VIETTSVVTWLRDHPPHQLHGPSHLLVYCRAVWGTAPGGGHQTATHGHTSPAWRR